MAVNDALKLICDAIETAGVVCYIGAAKQGIQVPYAVITTLPGRVSYYFNGKIYYHRLQLDYYDVYTGDIDDAYEEMETIHDALDKEAWGEVVTLAVSTPSHIIENGEIIHVIQYWEWTEDAED